eukprot:1189721-Pleurochrysis_carterae.AAC.1
MSRNQGVSRIFTATPHMITIKIDWSPARAWVAPVAETANDISSADDDTGSETRPKCIPENAILSHLNKQPLFRLGGAQTF